MPTIEAIAASVNDPAITSAPQHRRVLFSFAAYSKSVISRLHASGVPIAPGLTDAEFASIESAHAFAFPPELRSILREGLPIGAGFPNWRAASPSQLQILLSLPSAALLKEISKGSFWPASLGPKPTTPGEALAKARSAMESAPILVPIYRYFYSVGAGLSDRASQAGNPVFYVKGSEVRCVGFDIAGFFNSGEWGWRVCDRPAWAARKAKRVEVWSELAEEGEDTWKGWGSGWKEMGWRLREGGWREEEVREMLMMDGGDEWRGGDRMVLRDRESVAWHVRLLALALLRAGWSTEDVVYSMGGWATKPEKVVTWQVDPALNEIFIEL